MVLYNINRFSLLVMISWQFVMFFATQMLFPIFSMYVPRWRCDDDALSSSNFDKNCTTYENCPREKIIFENEYFLSAAIEFDWFCGSNSYIIYAYSQIQFFGVLLGTILFGSLSDCLGRKSISVFVLSFGILVLGLSGLGNFWQWLLATRFLIGLTIGGSLVVVCTYIMEMLLPEQRMPLRACFNWGVARLFVTAICYLLPNWRHASIGCAVAAFPVLLIITLAFPESPTWLHTKGRLEAMRNSERKIALVAGIKYSEVTHRPITKSLTFLESFKKLIKTGSLFRRIVVLWVMWFTAAISGYSIDLHSSNLSGNLFLNQIIFSVLTSVSKIILVVVDTKFEHFNRRMLHQGAQIVVIFCCAMLFLLINLDMEESIWILLISVIGLSFIEYTWDACYLCKFLRSFARNKNIGVYVALKLSRPSSGQPVWEHVARIGSIIAPTIVFLNTLWKPSIYAIVIVLGSLCLTVSYHGLEETKGVNLDEVMLQTSDSNGGGGNEEEGIGLTISDEKSCTEKTGASLCNGTPVN